MSWGEDFYTMDELREFGMRPGPAYSKLMLQARLPQTNFR
jgi:hypothetical protein